MSPRLLTVLVLALSFFCAPRMQAVVYIWTGIGDDALLDTPENWTGFAPPSGLSGDDLQFGAIGGPQFNILVPNISLEFRHLTFTSPSRPLYTFAGDGGPASVTLHGNVVVESGPDVSFGSSLYIVLNGTVVPPSDPSNYHLIDVQGAGTLVTVAGQISGDGNISKTGAGTLTLTGASTYSHSTDVNAGTLKLDGGSITHVGGDVTVGDVGGDNGTLQIINGADISGYAGVLGQSAGSIGMALVNGAGSTWTNAYTVDVGYSGTGTLTVANGGIVSVTGNTNTVSLGTSGGAGTLNIGAISSDDAAAGGFINADSISTGSGTGTLQFNTTGTVGTPYYLTKDGTAGGAAVAVTGNTAVVVNAGYTVLKGTNTYTGVTTINGGTLADSGADAFSAGSRVQLGAGGNLQVNHSETIGGLADGAGGGTATLASGATLTVNTATGNYFSGQITGAGTLTKTGAGTLTLAGSNNYAGGTFVDGGTLTVDESSISHSLNDTVVGHVAAANGTLNIVSSGDVTNRIGYLGYDATSAGTVTVTGSGSSWTNLDYLYVAQWGTGNLTISGGGEVTSPNTSIGNRTGSTGTVTVTGTDSILDNDVNLYVGSEGTGSLLLTAGGTATNVEGRIGNNAGGTGSATISGAGSEWVNTSLLRVGSSATGSLTLSAGGKVTVAGGAGTITLGTNTGVSGTVRIGNGAAGGLVNAATITTAAGTGSVYFNTTASAASPYYLTKDGTWAGTFVNITGPTHVEQQAGYNVLGGSASNYSGGTTITGGTLVAVHANALGTGTVNVNGGKLAVANGISFGNPITFGGSGGTLGGTGTFTNPLTLGNGVKIAPGDSPGTLSFASGLTLNNGGTLEIEIQAPTGTAGTDWDLVNITGAFNLSALTTGNYTLKAISLALNGNPGAVDGLNAPASWVIATASGGISGFEAADFSIDFSEFVGGGLFTLSQSGNNLVLNFTPVPEPSTYVLMASGLVLAGLAARRKRRQA